MNSKNKGSSFERNICKQISLWWSGGESDAIFWRTSNSGGRATVRTKSNKNTKNQYGDICAIDPIGQPLMDLFTFELKIGYSKHSIGDLLDKPKNGKQQLYEKWIEQARASQKGAGTKHWAIIAKRDRREVLVITSFCMGNQTPAICTLHNPYLAKICKLDDFLEMWTPEMLVPDYA